MSAVPPLDNVLEGVPAALLAERFGTPLYVYSASAIQARIEALKAGLAGRRARVCYAVKANSSQAILDRVARVGFGADIVSAGEMQRAIRAGIAPEHIVFSGVGKSADEIASALDAGIGRFNAESVEELDLIDALAQARSVRAAVALRINPDVDAGTHAKISTGKAENKFGIELDQARLIFKNAARWPALCIDGLHAHIGSQLLSLAPIRAALERVAAFWRELRAAGISIASIDVGGGLGVCYRHGHDQPPPLSDYLAEVFTALQGFEGEVVFEPGRWLVAEAGILLTRVLRIKQGAQRRFLVLDAAMNDLLRPSLYEVWHDIAVLHGQGRARLEYDVVGPVCETGDTFAAGRVLPEVQAGELVAILAAGAYGMSMASTYNSRPLPAEVMVEKGRFARVRARQSLEQMLAGECVPNEWSQP